MSVALKTVLAMVALGGVFGCGAATSLLDSYDDVSDGGRSDGREASDSSASGDGGSTGPDAPPGDATTDSDGTVSPPPDTDSGSDGVSGPGDSGGDGSEPEDVNTDAGPCVTADDCASLLGPMATTCIACPGGFDGCSRYVCLSGVCQTTWCGAEPLDSATECETASDCASLLGPIAGSCIPCSDGHDGCAQYVCLSGICQTTWCGAQPSDSATECATASDCTSLLGPIAVTCVACSGSRDGCEHYVCLRGVCQTTWCD